VPETLAPYPDETLIDLVRARARERRDAVALRFEGAVITYASLLRQAEAFGRALEHRGVQRGDRVALLLPNVPQFVVAELGAWMAGAIVRPHEPDLPGRRNTRRCSHGRAHPPPSSWRPSTTISSRCRREHPCAASSLHTVRDALSWPKSLLFRLGLERSGGHGTSRAATTSVCATY
jgi:hypothetical protein